MSSTTISYGSANWTYDEIDVTDNSTNAQPVLGTFKSNGTWAFVPAPDVKEKVWENLNRLRFGTLELDSQDLEKLLESIEQYGEELGKAHFILYEYTK